MPIEHARQLFQSRFNAAPDAVTRAPGRVEILGNHTDYNGGYVLTSAINRSIVMAGSKTGGDAVELYSAAMDQTASFPLGGLKNDPERPWADYVKGVLDQLQKAGVTLSGFRAVIAGDLPIGAGVSSSAALEASTAYLMRALFPYSMDPMDAAKLCRRAENEFVGMPCGLLDQFSSVFGEADSMLFLDCDTLEHKTLRLPAPAPNIVLTHSGVKHQLVESEYRVRREQCETAARVLGEKTGKTPRFLRDITLDEFNQYKESLEPVTRKRAQHVMEENQRVLDGVAALERGDLAGLGRCVYESHASSRDLFENTCPELDILIELSKEIPGCIGAKMTGGGFGGATVNLVEPDKTDSFAKTIAALYEQNTGLHCEPMICAAAPGAGIII